jgi:hypothetical protein
MAKELQAHMVRTPKGFLILRIFQLVLAVILMGLSIFGVIVLPLNSLCLTVFTVSSTPLHAVRDPDSPSH